MTLPITCSMCGGQIEPDDVAFREELIICPFCLTLNRITPTGTEKSPETVQKRRRPAGVKIEQNAAGDYLFRAKRLGGAITMPLILIRLFLLIPVGWLFLNAVFSFVIPADAGRAYNFFLFPSTCFFAFCGLWLSLVFVGIFKVHFSYIPPIKLTQDTLYGSEYANYWGLRPRVPVKEIRQIYTVAHKLQRIPPGSFLYNGIVRKHPEVRKLLGCVDIST
jgi:hypothetical protein